jgi:hypothetical protein
MASTSSQKASPSRSRARRAATTADLPADDVVAAAVAQDAPDTAEPAAPAPVPARKRTRRPARPPEDTAAAAPAEAPPAPVADPTPDPVAASEPAAAPARAGRTPRARKSAATATPAAAPEAPAAADAPADSPRPARKRTRRTAASTPADAPAATETETPVIAPVDADVIAAAPDSAPAVSAPAPTEPDSPPPAAATDTESSSAPVTAGSDAAPAPADPEITEPAEAPLAPIEQAAEVVAEPLPPHSALTLEDDGLRRRLHWRAGRDCPAELLALADTLDTPTDVAPLANDVAVLALVQRARARRHPLQVDEAVWDWLAQARDMRERVQVLEQAHPDGPASAALAALLTQPLRPYQAEAALYAACAGRCALADDAGLGKTVEAIAALRLLAQHFGAERALVLCPAERLADWQARWQAWVAPAGGGDAPVGLTLQIVDLATVAADPDTLAGLHADADVVVVDEPADADRSPWTQPALCAALQALPARHALALMRLPLDDRPAVLQAVLGWVDRPRFGALAVLAELDQRPDLGPAERAQVLAPWLLRRSKTQVLRQLPETVEQTVAVALAPESRAGHDTLLDALRQTVRRWQRCAYLSDLDQRRLLQTLHALRLGCNQDKPAALPAVLDTLLAAPDRRAVLFSQWPQSLDAAAAALTAAGISHLRLDDTLVGEARRAALAAFMADTQQRVLLCGDDGPGGHLGLRHAATALVHLDRPWNPAMLAQRLSRVHRTDRVRQVPVLHLIGADSLEARLQQAQDDPATRELFVGLIDGPQADAFLDGARLTRLMQAVTVLAGLADTATTAPATAA